MLQGVAGCCSVLQRVAVCCSVLQYVAACCSVLQRVATCCNLMMDEYLFLLFSSLLSVHWPLLSVNRSLLSVNRSLLSGYASFVTIIVSSVDDGSLFVENGSHSSKSVSLLSRLRFFCVSCVVLCR